VTATFGLGCAQLGNLYTAISDDEAAATVATAWDRGVRYYDTAPHYGLGLSERRLGAALGGWPRDAYEVSTKVGRLLVPSPADAARPDDGMFVVPATHRRVWDFSRDGVRRSLDASLARLGLDRVDLVLLHDPEGHAAQALDAGYPALHELRAAGVVRAIGVGSMDVGVLARFASATDIDVAMVAGRYTLLEQPALPVLDECRRRGITVFAAGVFNSGILAGGLDGVGGRPLYEYAEAPAPIVAKVRAIAAVCERHGSSLPAAALAFAGAHPAVTRVVVGAQTPAQVRENVDAFGASPPPSLWTELRDTGLLSDAAPTPVTVR
jgi:D-threo-aldose 1-dehydrogenase